MCITTPVFDVRMRTIVLIRLRLADNTAQLTLTANWLGGWGSLISWRQQYLADSAEEGHWVHLGGGMDSGTQYCNVGSFWGLNCGLIAV